jgi:hypothetical protein
MKVVSVLVMALCMVAMPSGAQVKIVNGTIIGEIRALAFEATPQVERELAAAGWIECAGQSLKVSDFPTLARLFRNAWGSSDGANTFYLPDLRGMFLRGWHHGARPGQAPPMGGDPDVGVRVPPRSSVPAPGVPGVVGDHVGSHQADQAKVEPHTHSEVRETATKERASTSQTEQFMHDPRAVQSGPPVGPATTWETRPKNAYVMFVIFAGRPVEIDQNGKIRPKG